MILKLRAVFLILFTTAMSCLLTGCKNLALFNPQGRIASSEMHLLIDAVLLMLIIVIPVILLTLIIAWRYRASNKKANYQPEWCHSNMIELVCWGVPIIIIIILGIMTWTSTHELDPYKPIVIKDKKTLTIQAVALDWKWLFIYPKQHIASVNFLQIPLYTPVRFEITADAPMNSMEIPRLAGQIYAMPAMRTKLYLTADHPGVYKGLSTNYSGDGFAGMVFKVKASSDQQFKDWVQSVKESPEKLTLANYKKLSKKSMNNKPEFFSSVQDQLFNYIIMQYLTPNGKNKTTKTVPLVFTDNN